MIGKVKKDIMGISVREGDIVIRPKFGAFSFHKVLKVTEKGLKLSVKRVQYNNNRTSYVTDSKSKEQIKEHNSSIYIGSWTNLLIIE
jgi:hypothetical protein